MGKIGLGSWTSLRRKPSGMDCGNHVNHSFISPESQEPVCRLHAMIFFSLLCHTKQNVTCSIRVACVIEKPDFFTSVSNRLCFAFSTDLEFRYKPSVLFVHTNHTYSSLVELMVVWKKWTYQPRFSYQINPLLSLVVFINHKIHFFKCSFLTCRLIKISYEFLQCT